MNNFLNNISLEDIKSINLLWDYEHVDFPREVIKDFDYVINPNEWMGQKGYVVSLMLEVDLEYMKTHHYYCALQEEEKTIFDFIQSRNVWTIELVLLNDNTFELTLPRYNKGYYTKNDSYWTELARLNEAEHHKIKKSTFVFEWYYDASFVRFKEDEMPLVFKNGLLKEEDYQIGIPFGLHIFRYLLDKEERKVILPRVSEYWSSKDIFLKKKKNYQMNCYYEFYHGLDTYVLSGKNHSYSYQIRFVLLINDSIETKKSLKEILQYEKNDTKNYLSRIIFIVSDKSNLSNDIQVLDKPWLSIEYKELNQLWLENVLAQNY